MGFLIASARHVLEGRVRGKNNETELSQVAIEVFGGDAPEVAEEPFNRPWPSTPEPTRETARACRLATAAARLALQVPFPFRLSSIYVLSASAIP